MWFVATILDSTGLEESEDLCSRESVLTFTGVTFILLFCIALQENISEMEDSMVLAFAFIPC